MNSIRKAVPEDSEVVVLLMINAMEELACKFTGTKNPVDAVPIFQYFFRLPDNQYSYQHTFVYDDGEIAGSITGYDGALLKKYRETFASYLEHQHYRFKADLEAETQVGEFYIDTVSVLPEKQGLGIGKQLIQTICQHAKALGHTRIALLVDPKNPDAKRLYEKLGFHTADLKQLAGKAYEHMIRSLTD